MVDPPPPTTTSSESHMLLAPRRSDSTLRTMRLGEVHRSWPDCSPPLSRDCSSCQGTMLGQRACGAIRFYLPSEQGFSLKPLFSASSKLSFCSGFSSPHPVERRPRSRQLLPFLRLLSLCHLALPSQMERNSAGPGNRDSPIPTPFLC